MNPSPRALLQVLPTVQAVQVVQALQARTAALPPQVTPQVTPAPNVGISPMAVNPIVEISNPDAPANEGYYNYI